MNIGAIRAFETVGLLKTAKTRWQKEKLTADLLQRIIGSPGNPIRKHLRSAATDLTPQQLAQHRKLQGLLAKQKLKNIGGKPENIPGIGPGFNAALGIGISPDAGTSIRQLAEAPNSMEKIKALKALASPTGTGGTALPVDKSILHSVTKHELGEKAVYDSKHFNPFSSHLGSKPVIDELQGIRDPEAINIMKKLRTMGEGDDPMIQKLLTQFGATGNYTPPAGGRVHRNIEKAIEASKLKDTDPIIKRHLLNLPIPKGNADETKAYMAQGEKALSYIPNFIKDKLYTPKVKSVYEEAQKSLTRPYQYQDWNQEKVKDFLGKMI